MPKTKEEGSYKKKYSENDIDRALKAIQNGMSRKEASKTFGIPRTTIIFRLSDKFVKPEHGPNPILTKEEEGVLVRWLVTSQIKGFPRRKEDVQACVKEFLDNAPRNNPFQNNTPGNGWFKAFLKRHPILTPRTSEAVTPASSAVSESNIRAWFSSIENYLTTEGYRHILDDPSRVFNGDETCFQLCPKGKKVLAPKGTKNVYEVDVGSAKSTLTVMFTFSADGKITPPMIIYPNKRRSLDISKTIPDEWGYGISDNGWMKAELFFEYIGNVLYPSLKRNGTTFPIILFVDGHATHMTYTLSELCSKLEIILIALYPNATRIIQPADVAAFKPLKNGWKKGVQEWRREHPMEVLTKEKFAPILKVVLEKCLEEQTVASGFRACGIYPWNPNALDYNKCLGKEYQKKDFTVDPARVLDYEAFKEIVGKDLVEQFQEYENYKNKGEDFHKLFKVWNFFSMKSSEQKPDEPNHIVNNMEDAELPQLGQPEGEMLLTNIDEGQYFVDENFTLQKISNLLDAPNPENVDALLTDQNKNPDRFIPSRISTTELANELNDVLAEDPNGLDIPDIQIIPEFTPICNPAVEETDGIIIQPGHVTPPKSVVEPTPTSKIEDVLYWPATPERKGKRKTERIPFVITSSQFKEMSIQKLELKQQKEKEVAENKRKRLEIKEAKEKNKENGKSGIKKPYERKPKVARNQPNTDKNKKINIISDITIISANSEEQRKAGGGKDCKRGTETNLETDVQVKKRKSSIRNCKADATPLSVKQIKKNTEPDKNLKKTNEMLNAESIISNELDNILPQHERVNTGLCYICTGNMSLKNKGIKCESCIRQYHIRCLLKHNLLIGEPVFFHCKICKNT